MQSSSELSYYIISLGCSKNLVDSEKINGHMIHAGFNLADNSEDADIIIINTCGFIESAKEESIDVIFDSINSCTECRIIVTGCLSERYSDEIIKEIPEIDLLYGLLDDRFTDVMCRKFNIKPAQTKGSRERKSLANSLKYSYIKISEGCSNRCNYCAIPGIRGPHRSFPPDAILSDSKAAIVQGAKELIIVAQDISQYSKDNLKLPGLVDMVSNLDGVEWIRLMYCHPDHIDKGIMELIKNNRKVVRYLDIPFQHADKRILESMGRRGDYNIYLELVQKLRSEIPGIRIRSTFMVGYPGETDEEYETLLDFLKAAEIDRAGCFSYSREENTIAYDLVEQVPEAVKKKRLSNLMKLQMKISYNKMKKMIGSEVEILIEDIADKSTYLCRTEFDAPEVDGVFFLTADSSRINSIVRARVTDATEYDLFGELI